MSFLPNDSSSVFLQPEYRDGEGGNFEDCAFSGPIETCGSTKKVRRRCQVGFFQLIKVKGLFRDILAKTARLKFQAVHYSKLPPAKAAADSDSSAFARSCALQCIEQGSPKINPARSLLEDRTQVIKAPTQQLRTSEAQKAWFVWFGIFETNCCLSAQA